LVFVLSLKLSLNTFFCFDVLTFISHKIEAMKFGVFSLVADLTGEEPKNKSVTSGEEKEDLRSDGVDTNLE